MKLDLTESVLKRSGLRPRAFMMAAFAIGAAPFVPSMAATLHVPQDYATIQAAVNAAAYSGDEVLIAPGVYTQQVLITQKQLILSGSPGTILQAWTGMKWEPPAPSYTIVDIRSNADVVVRNIEFDGHRLAASMPNRNACFEAITFFGTGGRVENCVIKGFRGAANLGSATTPPYGGEGYGVAAINVENAGPQPKHVQILNNSFSDNGRSIVIAGAFENLSVLRTTIAIVGNSISGVGPTALDYQIGIYIRGGVSGAINRNRITGHYNANPSGVWSFGILANELPLALQPLRIEGNTLKENEVHVLGIRADDTQIINNFFEGSDAGFECKGVYLTGSDILVAINQFTNLASGIVLTDEKSDPDLLPGSGRAIDPLVLANRFSCNVSTPLDVRPGVTGVIELGREFCSPAPPWNLTCSPATGLPGTTVILSGTNLIGTTAVLFNGLSAEFTPGTDADTEIVATVPPHATTGPVTVITPLGNVSSLSPFIVPTILTMVHKGNNQVELSWCADACDLVLESSSNLRDWQAVPASPSVGTESVTWRGPLSSGAQFFRLRQPCGTDPL